MFEYLPIFLPSIRFLSFLFINRCGAINPCPNLLQLSRSYLPRLTEEVQDTPPDIDLSFARSSLLSTAGVVLVGSSFISFHLLSVPELLNYCQKDRR